MFFRILFSSAVFLFSLNVSAAKHLDITTLVTLTPEPNIKPTFAADGKTYQSGGIGIMVYDGANAMDALGPFQVFASAGLKPLLISASKDVAGAYKKNITFNNGLQITANRTVANTPNLEVLVIPGGTFETIAMAKDTAVLNWIKTIHQKSVYTASVCTGSWILGATGLLKGKKATSNWYRATALLQHFGAIPKPDWRYVFDGKIITANGVTAGMDMALALVKRVFANDLYNGSDFTQAVMLDLQYDPEPPVVGGSPSNTEPAVFNGMMQMYDYYDLANAVKTIPAP